MNSDPPHVIQAVIMGQSKDGTNIIPIFKLISNSIYSFSEVSVRRERRLRAGNRLLQKVIS